MTDKHRWPRVTFGDVVRLNTDRVADPSAAGIERYVGLEHIEPEDLRIRRWGLVADGTTFTNLFRPGQGLFGKRQSTGAGLLAGSWYYITMPANDLLGR